VPDAVLCTCLGAQSLLRPVVGIGDVLKPVLKGELEMTELLLPKFDYYLDESDPDIVILRRQDGARSWQPSVREGPRGRASWRPPRRTTGGWSRPTRTFWVFEETATERGALNPGASLFTRVRGRSILGSTLLRTPLWSAEAGFQHLRSIRRIPFRPLRSLRTQRETTYKPWRLATPELFAEHLSPAD
jgi:hypothetical protein